MASKEYYFRIDGKLMPGEMRRLEQGVRLEDGLTAPAKVKELDAPDYNYGITIHEGRNRQVRRMLHALGHEVTALKRVRIGSLHLGDLGEGEVREIKMVNNILFQNS